MDKPWERWAGPVGQSAAHTQGTAPAPAAEPVESVGETQDPDTQEAGTQEAHTQDAHKEQDTAEEAAWNKQVADVMETVSQYSQQYPPTEDSELTLMQDECSRAAIFLAGSAGSAGSAGG